MAWNENRAQVSKSVYKIPQLPTGCCAVATERGFSKSMTSYGNVTSHLCWIWELKKVIFNSNFLQKYLFFRQNILQICFQRIFLSKYHGYKKKSKPLPFSFKVFPHME